jgi:hypothetical protein
VLPPLAAAGDANSGDYALSTDISAVAKVSDLKQLRRAFVGDFLSTSAPLAAGGGGASGSGGGGGLHNYAATAGLPFGIYKIISRMQAMARGYLTRKRMGRFACIFERRPLASPVRVDQWRGFISSWSNRCSCLWGRPSPWWR